MRFDDLRHGQQMQTPAAQCGDLLLRDRLGQWTYQFAVVVDDLAHAIDLIIRGDDLLASTGRQLMLAERLGRDTPPAVLHHPLVVHPDGTKLSKSLGDTALRELRESGWSAARVLGQAAWLGGLRGLPRWTPPTWRHGSGLPRVTVGERALQRIRSARYVQPMRTADRYR
ncbi:MAG: glutamate--tRNA ligase family protein [Gemmatimonadaceae bacterium]|nr:glutamate--tRNA ligase family protein [Gemmatimonadaceae bacterium]